jgi:DNA-binding transcriptional regulator/RsmH inhibitor MraZ
MTTVDYFERKLDDKRRLTIPAELRSEFASGVVVTRGFKNYLHLYPTSVWEEQVDLRQNWMKNRDASYLSSIYWTSQG